MDFYSHIVPLSAFWVNWLLKSTLILGLALFVLHTLKGHTARLRRSVWIVVFSILMAVPVFALFSLIEWSWTSSDNRTALEMVETIPVPYEALIAPSSQASSEVDVSSYIFKSNTPHSSWNWFILDFSTFLVVIWLIGFLYSVCQLALAYFLLKKVIQQGEIVTTVEWTQALKHIKKQLALKNNIRIIQSHRISIPMIFGFERPVILLPPDAETWTADKIEITLCHELNHLKVKDNWANLFVCLIKSIYWFHPLVGIAHKKMALDCEKACDEWVIKQGISPTDYAAQLVDFARNHVQVSSKKLSLGLSAMSKNSDLKNRITHLLQAKKTPSSKFYPLKITIKILFVLAVLPLMAIHLEPTLAQRSNKTLFQQLQSHQATDIIQAAKLLGERKIKAAYPFLTPHFQHADPKVRASIVWALGQVQEYNAIHDLLKMMDDSEDCVQIKALLSLGEYGKTSTFYEVKDRLKNDNPEVRKAALWTLSRIACLPAFRYISEHQFDSDQNIQLLSKQLLKQFDQERLRLWLLQNLQKPSARGLIIEQLQTLEALGTMDLMLQHAIHPTRLEAAKTLLKDKKYAINLEAFFNLIVL